MKQFGRGLMVGGLLGAGIMWLNVTKKGRQTREQLLSSAKEIYSQVKEEVRSSKQWKKMTKSEFATLVQERVDQYIVKHPTLAHLKDLMTKIVVAQYPKVKLWLSERGKDSV